MAQQIRSKKVREFVEVLVNALKKKQSIVITRKVTEIGLLRFSFAKLDSVTKTHSLTSVWIKISKSPYLISIAQWEDGDLRVIVYERRTEVAEFRIRKR